MITHRTYRIPVEKATSVFSEDDLRRVAGDVAYDMAESEGLQHARITAAWRVTAEGIEVVAIDVVGWLPPAPTPTGAQIANVLPDDFTGAVMDYLDERKQP